MQITVGIITISDRASAGDYKDLGGPALKDEAYKTGWQLLAEAIVPDDLKRIQETIRSFAQQGCGLILMTGGTGIGPRDVTPEATDAVCDKILDGFGEQMRAVSLKVVPTAILSRQIAGVRGKSLIVNLPGKPSAIRDCLLAVFPAIPYCIDLIEGPYLTTTEAVVKAFRPRS